MINVAAECRGLPLAFGTFEAFYAEDFLSDHSPSSIAWIGTMQNFLLVRDNFVPIYR